MRRRLRGLIASSLVAGMIVLVGATPGAAQVFRLGAWEGALEALVDFNRLETKTKGSPQTTSENLRTEERLTLRNIGVYICPGTEMADLVAYIIAVQHE